MNNIENLAINEKSEHERELTITVPKELVSKKFNSMLKNLQKKASRPGFRAGKLPFAMVKEMYQEKIIPELMEDLVKETLTNACEEKKLIPVSRPHFEPVGDFSYENDFTYRAVFQIKPDIDVKNFENLKIELLEHTFSDKDVEDEINYLRAANATFVEPKDRTTITKNDLVVGDAQLKVDGVLDSMFIKKDFEIAMFEPTLPEKFLVFIGKNINDVVELEHDTGMDELKDKKCELIITIKQLKERILPAVDDELAKDISPKFKSLAELKDSIVARFNITKKRRDEYTKKSNITNALMEQNPFTIPDALIESVTASLINEEIKKMPKEYREKFLKDHWQEIWESNKKNASYVTKSELIYENLIGKLAIECSEEDVDIIVTLNKNLSRQDAEFNAKVNKLLNVIESKSQITKIQKPLFTKEGE